MNAIPLRVVLAGLFAASALSACDRDADRTLGQKLDNAVSRTQTELAAAGHKTKEELAVAGEKTRVALNEATQKVEAKTSEAKAEVGSPENHASMSECGNHRVHQDRTI